MSFEIYHQLGHNDVWNFICLEKDDNDERAGNGVILSPKDKQMKFVEAGLDKVLGDIKDVTIFDPQFFFPSYTGAEADTLKTYRFYALSKKKHVGSQRYKNKAGEIRQREIWEAYCLPEEFTPEHAEECVDFQFRNNFRYYVIPTRHFSTEDTNTFIENQETKFILPFMTAIRKNKAESKKEVFLQIVLSKKKLVDEKSRTQILNFAMKYREVQGIYLIVSSPAYPLQIRDKDFLYTYLHFVDELVNKKMKVILGYVGIESVLLSVSQPSIVTLGISTPTTRFYKKTGGQGGGPKKPKPKLYSTKLLQFVPSKWLDRIEIPKYFDMNRYGTEALNLKTVKKPNAACYNCLAFFKQLCSIRNLDGEERFKVVHSMIKRASGLYPSLGVISKDVDGQHLSAWLEALNAFGKEKGWG